MIPASPCSGSSTSAAIFRSAQCRLQARHIAVRHLVGLCKHRPEARPSRTDRPLTKAPRTSGREKPPWRKQSQFVQ